MIGFTVILRPNGLGQSCYEHVHELSAVAVRLGLRCECELNGVTVIAYPDGRALALGPRDNLPWWALPFDRPTKPSSDTRELAQEVLQERRAAERRDLHRRRN